MAGSAYGGHTLAKALELAAILSDVQLQIAIVDSGYKGVAIDGVRVYPPRLRRGITRGLRAMIWRRSAIEPVIGHMKVEGKLDRNWHKGSWGRRDSWRVVLWRSQPNSFRMILRKMRFFYAPILAALLNDRTVPLSAA